MRTKLCVLIVAALAPTAAQAIVSDELCARLRTFELAQLPNDERRYFEFHWGFDRGALWSWACRHSKDQLAKTTCDWLMNHTDQEFSMRLPLRIMECHGYRFPASASYDWRNIEGTIQLTDSSNRLVVMDLNYRDLPNGEQAVRVSVEDSNKPFEPPTPIEPFGELRRDNSAVRN